MRCSERTAAALVLCCVLRWQLASAHPTATATAQHQRRRLQGIQPSTADAAHEHTAGLVRQLRELDARVTDRKPTRSQSSGARRRLAASHEPAKPHGGHKHPSQKPSSEPESAPTKHVTQHKRPSSSPHVHSHSSQTPAEPSTARRSAASDDTDPLIDASTVITKRACGVAADSDSVKQQVQERLLPTIGSLVLEGRLATVYVNVYFNINRVGALGDISLGDVTQAQIDAQINQLNHCFASASFVFQLNGVSRYTRWWNLDVTNPALADFKASTRKGTYADLNIFTTMLQNNVLGVTTMPWYNALAADGEVLHPWALPAGLYDGYNLGNTGCHETGHWLGLLHTFEGGCSEPNDGVSDTAEEAQPQFGCPSPAPSSCPNKPSSQPQRDPINSYMDYSPDACMTMFTNGQQLRMQAAWASYRSSAQQQQVAHLPSSSATHSASSGSKPKTNAKAHPKPQPKPHPKPHPGPHPTPKRKGKPHRKPNKLKSKSKPHRKPTKPKSKSKPHKKPTKQPTPRHG